MKREVVIGMIVIYLILFLSKKMEYYFPELINNYLSDLICMPIVLSIARYGVAYWFNDATFKLNICHIASATIAFIVVFEIFLPSISLVYTADIFDAILYVIGASFFYTFQTNTLFKIPKHE